MTTYLTIKQWIVLASIINTIFFAVTIGLLMSIRGIVNKLMYESELVHYLKQSRVNHTDVREE